MKPLPSVSIAIESDHLEHAVCGAWHSAGYASYRAAYAAWRQWLTAMRHLRAQREKAKAGPRKHNAPLAPDLAERIRAARRNGDLPNTIALRFGVSARTVYRLGRMPKTVALDGDD